MLTYHIQDRMIACLAAFALGVLSACGDDRKAPAQPDNTYVYDMPEALADGWPVGHLDSLGVASTRLEALMNDARAGAFPYLHSLVVVKDGALAFEEYFQGWQRDSLHRIMSCTKSFTSSLIGIALDRGLISSVDTPVFNFFPEYDSLRTPQKDLIRLRHVLSMSAGLEWDQSSYPFTDPRNSLVQMWAWDDYWAGFTLSREVVCPPTGCFAYSDGLACLAGQVIQRVTGEWAHLWADTVLMAPLGITDYRWEGNWRAMPNTGYGLYMRPRDMAKFGQLYLNHGVWDGRRIISEAWVNTATSREYTLVQGPPEWSYGQFWWIRVFLIDGQEVTGYLALGMYGQFIWVFESLNLVVVYTMDAPENQSMDEAMIPVTDFILPAAL